MFLMPNNMFPSSSVAMMQQATNSNKTAEEQLKAIKEIAQQITLAIQSEMANLMSYAVNSEKETEENKLRKRRSVETPMDSTQMVMRLLKHIKSNNEYQNIAIEKMMSAQEIADKFGIDFNPDPEIISDLALAANEHTQELANLLEDACELKNVTHQTVEFVPFNDQNIANDTYYAYALHSEEKSRDESIPYFEYEPDLVSKPQAFVDHINYHSEESQIPVPPHHHHHHHHHVPPVTPRPNFFESFPFTPASNYNGHHYSEPISTTYILAVEEPDPEPEIVGEEIEETITSKLFVERGDEPGSATVNHITTYTVAEKSHYRSPQIERLPEQLQYCFLLI